MYAIFHNKKKFLNKPKQTNKKHIPLKERVAVCGIKIILELEEVFETILSNHLIKDTETETREIK